MNIWHDMDPRRITTERFDAVVEIRGVNNQSTNLIKKQD